MTPRGAAARISATSARSATAAASVATAALSAASRRAATRDAVEARDDVGPLIDAGATGDVDGGSVQAGQVSAELGGRRPGDLIGAEAGAVDPRKHADQEPAMIEEPLRPDPARRRRRQAGGGQGHDQVGLPRDVLGALALVDPHEPATGRRGEREVRVDRAGGDRRHRSDGAQLGGAGDRGDVVGAERGEGGHGASIEDRSRVMLPRWTTPRAASWRPSTSGWSGTWPAWSTAG
jgi:hypothetical protein